MIGLTLGLACPVPAAADPTAYGDCEVDVFRAADSSGDDLVAVTVRNRGEASFGALNVELWGVHELVDNLSSAPLRPGESTVVRVSTSAREGALYVVLRYSSAERKHEIAVPVPPPVAADPAGGTHPWLAWLAPILSFAGAILGVWFGHIAAARRERSRIAAEARSKQVDRDGPAYHSFLEYWARSRSSSHLEKAFGELCVKAAVSKELREVYHQTLQTLRSPASTAEVKDEAANRLYNAASALTSYEQSPLPAKIPG